jgi:hypothetical protein
LFGKHIHLRTLAVAQNGELKRLERPSCLKEGIVASQTQQDLESTVHRGTGHVPATQKVKKSSNRLSGVGPRFPANSGASAFCPESGAPE